MKTHYCSMNNPPRGPFDMLTAPSLSRDKVRSTASKPARERRSSSQARIHEVANFVKKAG
jgi:hypothetical protein